ncbi:hypothetical protein [Streptomyces sp. NRRL S-4]|uniref:hypothetical protein n=1 Tax=Streptomyces sp. NRRL S-4 TaxID=1519471 RepID=UPI0006B4A286|nr:hypothetical protein [Streptomyces sp. NRRL S-4]KPC79948.1 hypothetical protein ADK82_23955 [Streptomyces sp. NRRL S-4]
MSMPPQGPYGPPPTPHGPYGQQPQPGPYGQQHPPGGHPPQPAYAYPPQAAPGPPGPWGHPGVPGWQPRPPRRTRAGLVVGLVLGVSVLVVGLGFGAFTLVDKGADAAFPEATHKLVVPEKVLDGEFTLAEDLSDTEGKEIEDAPDPRVRDGEAAVAHYATEEGGVLVLSGMYGRLASPVSMREEILKGAAGAEGAEAVVPPREFEPDGYGITVECQVVRWTDLGTTTYAPMCAWGDANTAAMVAVIRPTETAEDAQSVDLTRAAEETAMVRAEIRRPLG